MLGKDGQSKVIINIIEKYSCFLKYIVSGKNILLTLKL